MRSLYAKLVCTGRYVENTVAGGALLLIACIPAAEVLARLIGGGVHSATEYVQHLVLWITFAGAMITSREGRHLALSVGVDLLKEPLKNRVLAATSLVATTVSTILTWSAWYFTRVGFGPDRTVGIVPMRIVMLVMPVGFAVLTLRFILRAPKGIHCKLVAAAGIPLAWLLGGPLHAHLGGLVWPLSLVLIAAALLGMPIFVVLGGLASLLFASSGGTIAVIPNEAYTMLSGPVIPTIPLFTLAGFLLSESKAGERLVRLFDAAVGWLPGGLAIMATVVCAFFTTFTGASGVTILALGGLLSYMLVQSRYPKGFTTGLLTASGSIGLLFPPSLPIILYGVVARISIKKMFVGGIIPGLLMVVTVAALGVRAAVKHKTSRGRFRPREAAAALKDVAWELLFPVIIIVLFFRGITTLVETGAISVLYALFVETVIHRDIKPRALPGVFLKCVPLIGGVLIILAVANGLSFFIVDAEIPMKLASWVSAHVSSRYVFLIVLNIALLITGCFMDIFSATMVVVPLIIPLAESFGVHPVHLGIIFLANLELGYLTPPVGINLFLSSFRFEEPLAKVYKDVLPFLIALIVAVLLITYVPWMTTGLLGVVTF